jgi:nicotinate-nucleotide adenylyltransferase
MSLRRYLYGGSFNPAHEAHLALADFVCRTLKVEKISFVLSKINPLKRGERVLDATHRFEMLKRLVGDRHEILDWEIRREGLSWTLDTLRQAWETDGQKPVFVLGADNLENLHRWKEVRKLFDLADFQLVSRARQKLELSPELQKILGDKAEDHLREVLFMPPLEVSSRDIRRQLACGKKPKGLPESVYEYIVANELYGFRP